MNGQSLPSGEKEPAFRRFDAISSVFIDGHILLADRFRPVFDQSLPIFSHAVGGFGTGPV